MKLAGIAWRNIFRNKRRSILSFSAIAVASMGIVLLFGIIDWMKEDMRKNLFNFYTGQIRIRHEKFDTYEHMSPLHLKIENTPQLLQKLSQIEGIEAISPRITFPAVYVETGGEMVAVTGRGVDMEKEKSYSHLHKYLREGKIPTQGKREIIISPYLRKKFGVQIGDSVTFLARTATYGTNAMTFRVVGIIQLPVNSLNQLFFLPLDTAQKFLRMRSESSETFNAAGEVLLKVKPGYSEQEIIKSVRGVINKGDYGSLEVISWKKIKTGYTFVRVAEVAYNIIALFFFVLGSTVIINTTMMVIYERMREIGTMSALGMEGGALVSLFFLESLYIAVLGSFTGVFLGWLISYPFSIHGIDFSRVMTGMSFELSSVYYLKPSIKSLILIFFYSVGIAALSSIFPSIKAAKLDPIQALHAV